MIPLVNSKYQNINQCCELPNIIISEGNFVCQNCGTVIERVLLNEPPRAYNSEERKNRISSHPSHTTFLGTRTIFDNKCDGKGKSLSPLYRTFFYRLAKIQASQITSKERNFSIAIPILKQIQHQRSLPSVVFEDAIRIYATSTDAGICSGRSIPAVIAAAIYLSCRCNAITHNISKVVQWSGSTKDRVMSAISAIMSQRILKKLNLSIARIPIENYLQRIGSEHNVDLKIQQLAIDILKKTRKGGVRVDIGDHRGYIAAALYVSSRENRRYTQTELSKMCGITEVTIRNRLHLIQRALNANA